MSTKTTRHALQRRETLAAMGFLLPNFLGFLLFTSLPVVFSLAMAFMHWNIFKTPEWVGVSNFVDLLGFTRSASGWVPNDPFFWQYLGNTIFLLMAVPLGIAGSLCMALLMNQKLRGMVIYRTIYFIPTICSGVALLILWKYLYNAEVGLVNKLLRSAGASLFSNSISGSVVTLLCIALAWVLLLAVIALAVALIDRVLVAMRLPLPDQLPGRLITGAAVLLAIGLLSQWNLIYGSINAFLTEPPDWLGTVSWAKPALILMGLWGGLGGVNTLLYLAALQEVPRSQYEAAELDGAGSWAKFWNVTWPNISPTTFFILIMGIIGGFQGGFVTANVMTGGGPAGSTTTIEYYLYTTAFEKFNMGYASTIAWFVFAVVLLLTLLTWRLGGRVVHYD